MISFAKGDNFKRSTYQEYIHKPCDKFNIPIC